jgi:hypothetical protein
MLFLALCSNGIKIPDFLYSVYDVGFLKLIFHHHRESYFLPISHMHRQPRRYLV